MRTNPRCRAVRLVGILSVISTIWHIVVTFTLVALLSAVAPTHQTSNYVFTSLNVPDVGIDSHAYIFFLGLLMVRPRRNSGLVTIHTDPCSTHITMHAKPSRMWP